MLKRKSAKQKSNRKIYSGSSLINAFFQSCSEQGPLRKFCKYFPGNNQEFEMPVSEIQICANSCTSVNNWGAFQSSELIKTKGA